jgi:hypothetical protein
MIVPFFSSFHHSSSVLYSSFIFMLRAAGQVSIPVSLNAYSNLPLFTSESVVICLVQCLNHVCQKIFFIVFAMPCNFKSFIMQHILITVPDLPYSITILNLCLISYLIFVHVVVASTRNGLDHFHRTAS